MLYAFKFPALKLSLAADEPKFLVQCEIHQKFGLLILVGVFAALDFPDQIRVVFFAGLFQNESFVVVTRPVLHEGVFMGIPGIWQAVSGLRVMDKISDLKLAPQMSNATTVDAQVPVTGSSRRADRNNSV
jgi:hypothetical protein